MILHVDLYCFTQHAGQQNAFLIHLTDYFQAVAQSFEQSYFPM